MAKDKKKKNTPEEEAAMNAAKIAEEIANEEADKAVKENADGEAAAEGTGEGSPEAKKIAELQDKVVRQMAEFDNYRKRTEKEKESMYDLGARIIVEKILPTIDNFERGLVNAPDDAFAEGMKMVYKQLLKNLEDAGVKSIDCVGKEFDPNIHNAVMHEEDDSDRSNIVSEELQKGYMYKNTLVRPSMVKVVN